MKNSVLSISLISLNLSLCNSEASFPPAFCLSLQPPIFPYLTSVILSDSSTSIFLISQELIICCPFANLASWGSESLQVVSNWRSKLQATMTLFSLSLLSIWIFLSITLKHLLHLAFHLSLLVFLTSVQSSDSSTSTCLISQELIICCPSANLASWGSESLHSLPLKSPPLKVTTIYSKATLPKRRLQLW